jgi:hypothetical protein
MPTQPTIYEELELERAVVRTADTIREVYFSFREPLFEMSIVNIEERDHNLVLHIDNTQASRKKGWFVDLPRHLTQSEGIVEAIICFLMGREPLAYLLDLIMYLTDGKGLAVLNTNQAYTL